MSVAEFNVESLASLDGGRVAEALMQAIRRCVNDCDDRPGVKAARGVRLLMKIAPVANDDGTLDEIKMQFTVTDSAPKRESKTYSMAFRKGGKLAYNDLSVEDVKQRTFDENANFNG